MAEVLIHKTMDGEPIGILNDAGESYYAPGFASDEATGKWVVKSKGWAVPWSVFIRRRADTTNFTDWWAVLDTSEALPVALEHARDTYFASAPSPDAS